MSTIDEADAPVNERDYRTIIQTSIDGFWIADMDGCLVDVNDAYCQMIGYSRQELLQMRISDIDMVENRRSSALHMKQIARTGYDRFETRHKRKDGTTVSVEVSATFSDDKGGRFISFLRDISERKNAEEAIAQAQLQKEQLVHTDRMVALGTLVSGVAHEINNPNNFVMLNAPILRDAWDSILPILDQYYENNGDFVVGGLDYSEMRENISPMFDAIRSGSMRIKNIVSGLKSFARIGPDDLTQTLDVNEVCQSAVSLLQGQINKSTKHFIADYATDVPIAMGNPQRISQVIINLLQNSCQSLADSGRAVKLMTSYVAEEKAIRVEVSDQGSGMSPEVIDHATVPFYTTKRDSGGTGLGLSVSLGIVQNHGGTLAFNSTPRRGTTAVVMLPVRNTEHAA